MGTTAYQNETMPLKSRFGEKSKWAAIVFSLILFILFCLSIYFAARNYVIHKAEQEIENLILQHRGVHHYIQRNMHPELYRQKDNGKITQEFYSPVMFSSSYMVRNMHNYMNEEREKSGQDTLYYKMAADSPRNPVNKADANESRILKMFNADRELTEYRDTIKIDGQLYLQVALPFLQTTKPCLKCHGRREDSPLQLQELYPGQGGFNENVGSIRAIESIRVPLDERLTIANIVMVAFAVIGLGFLALTGFNRRLQTLVNDQTEKLKNSEERLNLAMHGANDGLWDWNIQKNIMVFDERYYTMAGYEPYEFPCAFDEWKKRVHPEDLEATEKEIQKHISGVVDIFQSEFRFKKKDGRYMWIRGRGRIFSRDSVGNSLRFVGTHSDITSLKNTETELRYLRNSLENIIDSMPSVLIGVDECGKITQWNNKAQQSTGVTKESALGQTFQTVCPALSDKINLVKNAISKKKVCSDLCHTRIENGQVIYEDIIVYPLCVKRIEGAVIRIDDITEKVRMEEMMIQSEKMLSIGGIAAGMAHEINNPLAGMVQSANVMKSRLGNVDMQANLRAADELGISTKDIKLFMEKRGIFRMIDAIQESGVRAAEIVSSMLSFARKSDANISSHQPTELMDQILELAATDYNLKKQYDFKSMKIIKEYADDLPLLPCEGAKIQQVLLNILRNGAQAMGEANTHSPRFIIRIYSEKASEMVCIEIEDNGPGMDEETRSKVFDPFFTTKPVGVGTGLGLSVSYFIITESHQGTMDVISEPGKGTTFIIRLPIHRKNQ